MPVYKDKVRNTWYVSYRYTDWKGEYKRYWKRGFKSKREAVTHETQTRLMQSSSLDMTFNEFCDIYMRDKKNRLREGTWENRLCAMNKHIIPYFGKRKIKTITSKDVIAWQDEIMNYRDSKGNPYKQGYLRTLHTLLSAIFNYAVKHYDLKDNPARKAGSMGRMTNEEIKIWTKEEYLKFSEYIRFKPDSYYAFEILYWTGMRLGEMLILTPDDFDFTANTVRIVKSYTRVNRKDIINPPKTIKGIRTMHIPDFLSEEIEDYINSQYKLRRNDRIFSATKSILSKDMKRGCEKLGLEKITLHGFRHSHVSLLIERGFTALAIADRVGHETISITYKYAHLFPSKQREIATLLSEEK